MNSRNFGNTQLIYNSATYNSANRPTPNRAKFVDVHELQKAEIFSQGNDVNSMSAGDDQPLNKRIDYDKVAGTNAIPVEHFDGKNQTNSPYDKLSQMIPRANSVFLPIPTELIAKLKDQLGRDDRYCYCDSSQKATDSKPSEGLYIFDVAKLNNNVPMKTIIGVDIGSMRIPRIETDPLYQPNYQYFRRVMVDIQPVSVTDQVNTGIQQRNFIFEFEVVNDGLGFLLLPVKTPVIFSIPIQSMQTLQFRFKVPYQRNMTFEQDTFNFSAVIPAPGPPPADRRIQTTVAHNLPIGSVQAIWITNYNSANQDLNNTLNNVNGLLADVIDATTLQLTTVPNANLIATTFTLDGAIPTGIVNIGMRRIAFQIKLQCLVAKYTNYVQPAND